MCVEWPQAQTTRGETQSVKGRWCDNGRKMEPFFFARIPLKLCCGAKPYQEHGLPITSPLIFFFSFSFEQHFLASHAPSVCRESDAGQITMCTGTRVGTCTSTMFKRGFGTETSSQTRSHAYPRLLGGFVNAYHTGALYCDRTRSDPGPGTVGSLKLDGPRYARRHQIVRCISTDRGTIWMMPGGNSALIVIVSVAV